jgi:hypothetical protein
MSHQRYGTTGEEIRLPESTVLGEGGDIRRSVTGTWPNGKVKTRTLLSTAQSERHREDQAQVQDKSTAG